MRVYLKTSSKSQVTSHKSPIPNPKFYPLILSRHQGEILKIPCSKFQVPRSKNGRAMENLENHRLLSASVYGSLPNPGGNESVF